MTARRRGAHKERWSNKGVSGSQLANSGYAPAPDKQSYFRWQYITYYVCLWCFFNKLALFERTIFTIVYKRINCSIRVTFYHAGGQRAESAVANRRDNSKWSVQIRGRGNNKSAGGPQPPIPYLSPHIKGEPAIPYKSPNETNPWRNRGDGKRWGPRGTRQILIIVKAAAPIKREGVPPPRGGEVRGEGSRSRSQPRPRAPVTCAHRGPH